MKYTFYFIFIFLIYSCLSPEAAREKLARKCSEQFPCTVTKTDTTITVKTDTFKTTQKVIVNVPCPPIKGDTSQIIKVIADCPSSDVIHIVKEKTILKTVEDSAKIVTLRADMRSTIERTVMLWSDSTTILQHNINKLNNTIKIYKWGIALILMFSLFIIGFIFAKIKGK